MRNTLAREGLSWSGDAWQSGMASGGLASSPLTLATLASSSTSRLLGISARDRYRVNLCGTSSDTTSAVVASPLQRATSHPMPSSSPSRPEASCVR